MTHTAQRPLWRHLWTWTLVAISATWIAMALVAYLTALHEADEISDAQLSATAQVWLKLPTLPTQTPNPAAALEGFKPGHHTYEQPWAVLVWEDNTLVLDSHGLAPHGVMPPPAGYSTQQVGVGQHTQHWRQYTVTDPHATPQRRVTVVLDLDTRNALARDIAEHVTLPALVVLPGVALLLAWALRRGLLPLHNLSTQISALDLSSHQRLDGQHRFEEFSSTVTAINALMDRLQAQIQQERAFASDIAHELRTPLTAISLQAHVIAHDADPKATAAAALALQTQALLAGEMLAHLLAFARAQRQGEGERQPVCLADLLHRVVAQHAQMAHDTGHDMALDIGPGSADIHLQGQPLLLELAVRNLVDNALRHTATGTEVGVSLSIDRTALTVAVCDKAPTDMSAGLHLPRDSGLGLGLTLVKRIAAWHGAEYQHRTADTSGWTTRHALVWPVANVHRR